MPTLIVYGMPSTVAANLEHLIDRLLGDISNVIDADPSEVSVFFPADLVQAYLGEELVCLVEGLFRFENPELDDERLKRKEIAVTILSDLRTFAEKNLPQCKEIIVMVKRFNCEDGLASCDIP